MKNIVFIYENDMREGELMFQRVEGVVNMIGPGSNTAPFRLKLKDGTERLIAPGWIDARVEEIEVDKNESETGISNDNS